MKIVHFTLGRVNPNSSNGINKVIEGLAKYSNKIDGTKASVVTLKKDLKEKQKIYKRDGFEVLAFNSMNGVKEFFKEHANMIDIVHLHNVWSIQNITLSRSLIGQSIPYIITPHAGLLEDRVKGSNYSLKIIFHNILQKSHFNSAAALHAVSREEMTNIALYTSNKNIFSIPNGIDTFLIKSPESNVLNEKITIGYLGRLSEEKNIIGLIYSLNELQPDTLESIKVIIMGGYDNSYGKKCVDLVRHLGLDSQVEFTGKVSRMEKWQKLADLDIYIQPSFSEGASLSILEAMFCKLPVISTRTCNISYLQGQDFLKMVEPLPTDIARGITDVVNNIETFKNSGEKAHEYVCDNYDWEKITYDLVEVYKGIVSIK